MKRVLITGAGSYIGTRTAGYLAKLPERFQVETLDVKEAAWQQADFRGFDAVLHVAGLAHQKETPANAGDYDRINCQLALAVARKAKESQVSQFVFFSTMSVYGRVCGHITEETVPHPSSHYGSSKWKAEQALWALETPAFRVAILRPPMVYGPGCRGNYPRFSALVRKLPVFPKVRNQRSMLYIENLTGFLARLVESGQGGLYFPQNRAYVSTHELAREIALAQGKRLWQPRGLGWLLGWLSNRVGVFGKLFGSLTYDQAMSQAFPPEAEMPFAETIRATEAQP